MKIKQKLQQRIRESTYKTFLCNGCKVSLFCIFKLRRGCYRQVVCRVLLSCCNVTVKSVCIASEGSGNIPMGEVDFQKNKTSSRKSKAKGWTPSVHPLRINYITNFESMMKCQTQSSKVLTIFAMERAFKTIPTLPHNLHMFQVSSTMA